jgi:uncharacterized SAM-binding protein YcdF (DUF218 family)
VTAYLLALTVLAVYMTGVSLMTSQVTYPLYAAVPAGSFVEYHRRYNTRIPLVIVAPGFLCFLACATLPAVGALADPDTGADRVPRWAAVLVAAGGLTALVATAGAAIPSHLRLQRHGFQPGAYRTLRRADLIRTAGCLLSAGVLVAFLPRVLN